MASAEERSSAPDLVGLEVMLDELVEQVELLREVGLHLEQRIGAVFPANLYPVRFSVSSSVELEKRLSHQTV